MSGNEMHATRNMRSDIAHGGGLDRADVRHDRIFFKMRPDRLGDFSVCTDRRAQNYYVGAADGVGGIGLGFGNKPERLGLISRLGGRRGADDLTNESSAARRMAD